MSEGSGRFVVRRPRLPMLRDYCVVAPVDGRAARLPELLQQAEVVARREAAARFGDPECFSLVFNAGRTRRRPWPHVHIILAPTVAAKRRAMIWLLLKHVLRPRRWPGLRRLLASPSKVPPCR